MLAPSLPVRADSPELGTHWRLESDKGVIHVYAPPKYDARHAGLVVYVHGYRTSADRAWHEHRLREQFLASRQNALFVVPQAPTSIDDPVRWESLSSLRDALRAARIRAPDGPVIAVGHSGAYRTIARWVAEPELSEIILLDGLYRDPAPFETFAAAPKHKLILVGKETAKACAALARRASGIALEHIPEAYADFSARERRATLLYLRSQYGHEEIVAGGKVLPLLLRLTPLRSLT
jgi:hypothetical protein